MENNNNDESTWDNSESSYDSSDDYINDSDSDSSEETTNYEMLDFYLYGGAGELNYEWFDSITLIGYIEDEAQED